MRQRGGPGGERNYNNNDIRPLLTFRQFPSINEQILTFGVLKTYIPSVAGKKMDLSVQDGNVAETCFAVRER